MNLAIIGYGKMGKAVEQEAIARGHKILYRFDVNNKEDFTKENLKKTDLAFEFTTPSTAYDNVKKCLEAEVPVVCGTTGWKDGLNKLRKYAIENNKAFFYAPNFSLGVNLFFKINKIVAEIMNRFPDFDIAVEETHHIHKVDAPSGTAVNIAEQILNIIERKKEWKLNEKGKDILPVYARREGEIFGIHEVRYESSTDIIRIAHELKSRKSLAVGAVLAAEFLYGKTGFYTMEDMLNF